jgi:hypothetical protein
MRLISITPFEAAIAVLLIFYGVTALAHYGLVDPVTALLPGWEATGLSVMSVITGGLLLAGAALPYRGAEAAGLLFLIAVIGSRFLLYGFYLGFGSNFITTGVFDATLIWAALVRLVTTVLRGKMLVRISRPPE